MNVDDVVTCSMALLVPGQCCSPPCRERATNAVLDAALVEHAVCADHAPADAIGIKPLVWDPLWGPTSAASERSCRVCGCTDDRACPGGCFWVGPALCSRCQS